MSVHKELIIIGEGAAGLSAGIYAARGKIDTLLVESGNPGSQACTTEDIENYPGFPEGIGGSALIEKMKEQAYKFGLNAKYEAVTGLTKAGQTFTVNTQKEAYHSRAVIIASGASPSTLGVQGENEFRGKGVSYCATCDGAFFEDGRVAVVGGGDAALEEALYLTKYASRVYIVHRRDEFRAAPIITERVLNNKKIELMLDQIITKIDGSEYVESIETENIKSGKKQVVRLDGIFVYVGIVPNSGFATGIVETDKNGFIKADDDRSTSVPGLFAAGDVCVKSLRQVVTAVADGAIAATSAGKYLDDLKSGIQ